jgi:hypothetical protein
MRAVAGILFLSIVIFSCKGQTNNNSKSKEFSFQQVGWKVKIPEDFTVMDSARTEALARRGENAIERTYDTTLDFKATRTLISASKGQYNYFASTITPFDPAVDRDWEEANAALKNVIVETFQTQMPDMKIDTSSSVEKIDGLEFQKFHVVTTYPNKMVMNVFMYARLHKGYDFGINICYTDEETGEDLKKSLAGSKFEK